MIRITVRTGSTSSRVVSQFKLDPNYRLKCGLEIHTQLQTKYKLFSLSKSDFFGKPNSNVSYFDCGLPGTQPKLNPEALLLALKTAVALNCHIEPISTFDRKHYFYPDQPLGYQITQHYHPIATGGYLELNKFDNLPGEKIINIEQIQIEQDTGRTNYDKFDNSINIDLNRSNTPLIELVTKPDFENLLQVHAFVKKYQTLVRYLGICTGDLENGAIRVDVNLSINDNSRVEIKNLNSTSEIQEAIKYEYRRQINHLQTKQLIIQETRGWNGSETVSLRKKENTVDYRYFPDSELPKIVLDENIKKDIEAILPVLPDKLLESLTSAPYLLELKYAKFLVDHKPNLEYYYKLFSLVGVKANNWFFHELLGAFSKLDTIIDLNLITPVKVAELIEKIQDNSLSLTSARLILHQIIQNPELADTPITTLIDEYDLATPEISQEDLNTAIEEICKNIVEQNPDVVKKIKKGNKNSVKYLVGLAMKETQGKVNARDFTEKFKEII